MIVVDKKLRLIESANKLIPEDGCVKILHNISVKYDKILIGNKFQLISLLDECTQILREKASSRREYFGRKIQIRNGSEVILTYDNNQIYHSAIVSSVKLESGLSDKKQRLISKLLKWKYAQQN